MNDTPSAGMQPLSDTFSETGIFEPAKSEEDFLPGILEKLAEFRIIKEDAVDALEKFSRVYDLRAPQNEEYAMQIMKQVFERTLNRPGNLELYKRLENLGFPERVLAPVRQIADNNYEIANSTDEHEIRSLQEHNNRHRANLENLLRDLPNKLVDNNAPEILQPGVSSNE